MGGSNDQFIGYRYFTNFLLFIGNPIEKMLGINFDKRGWISPLVDENGNALNQGVINSPSLFGENEGGVAGMVNVQYGTNNQEVLPFYKDYMESIGLQASAYPYQSYLAFTGLGSVELDGLASGVFNTLMPQYNNAFYVGNSGYMKEMLLWPKRIHVRNDGRVQWYDAKSEVPDITYVDSGGSGDEVAFTTEWYQREGSNSEKLNQPEQSPGVGVSFTGDFTGLIGIKGEYKFSRLARGTIYVRINKRDSYEFTSSAPYTFLGEDVGAFGEIFLEYEIEFFGNNSISISFYSRKESLDREHLTISTVPTFEKSDYSYQYDSGDINPIHKIREILTDDTAIGKPESYINDVNFKRAADVVWDEGLGISWSITEKSCIDAINELCYHIESGVRVNRQTGLYEIVLFRDDWFEESEIHMIAESKIKSMQYEITNPDEVINQVNVNYYDRANIKNSSFSISESGLIQTLGRVNAETVDFPYFMKMRNAEIVANWKLKILSTGAIKGTFTTGLREARKWNRYDLIRLPWSKRWVGTILVRIMSIKLGGPKNNEVSIDFVEVVPSTGMLNTTIVADEPIDKPLPPQACQYEPFEMPYYFAVMALGQRKADEELAYESNFGLVSAVAEKPQENSLYAVMMTNNGDEWIRAGSIQYSVTADLDQIISKTSSSFTVKNWKKISNVPIGTLIKCGRDWLGTPGEWMVLQGVDPYTGIVSVKRGALDTPPQGWGIDTKLYFCGNDISYDQTEYVASENVLVSALTTTPSGVLEQKGSIAIEMKSRAIRPYLPANVKFNDTYFPETLIATNNIVLTWAHRNRVQQTGGEILGYYDGDVTVESGVTYAYELISENVVLDSQSNINANTVTILASVLKQNKPHTLKLWSARDGFDSYQKFEHSFFVESASLILSATTDGSKVSGNTVPTANINVVVDESLSANMKFDGSSISGKANAGSTITIEIQE